MSIAKAPLNKEEKKARIDFQKNLGVYLKQKREAAGCTQIEIAKLAGFENAQFISNIERGTCSVPPHVLRIMIEKYKVDSKEILSYLAELKMVYYKNTLFSSAKKAKSGKRLRRA